MTPRDPGAAPDDLFDAIARLLEPGQREYFYQRMLYFRHLRPDDELLRIVEAIGFLALVIREAPQAIAVEREQLAQSLATSIASIKAATETSVAHHKQLNDRLTRLPADVAKGISPPAIAQAITESLRQQFVHSGLPETANALAEVSRQLTAATGTFQRTVEHLTTVTGVAGDARRALQEMRGTVFQATEGARAAVADFTHNVRLDYTWSVTLLCSAALVLGMLLGFMVQGWRTSSSERTLLPPTAPVTQAPAPSPPPPASTKRAARGTASDVQ